MFKKRKMGFNTKKKKIGGGLTTPLFLAWVESKHPYGHWDWFGHPHLAKGAPHLAILGVTNHPQLAKGWSKPPPFDHLGVAEQPPSRP